MYSSVRSWCMLVYGVLLHGVHISRCKSTGCSFNNAKKNVKLQVQGSVYQCMQYVQLMHVSAWCAPTGVSYKQVKKYRVFIIIFRGLYANFYKINRRIRTYRNN